MGALDVIQSSRQGSWCRVRRRRQPSAIGGPEVIKIELPDFGDQSRWLPVSAVDSRSAYFIGCNRGKRSATVDLRTPSGRRVFLRLVADADVVITNFKPGTMEEWGLGYEELQVHNPLIVYAAGSTFGPAGDDSKREGADLSGQAAGGLISTTGVNGGDPTPVGATIADHIASQNLVSGILAALLARAGPAAATNRDLASRRSGVGPGERIHRPSALGPGAGSSQSWGFHGSWALWHLSDVGWLDRGCRRCRSSSGPLLREARTTRISSPLLATAVLRVRQGRICSRSCRKHFPVGQPSSGVRCSPKPASVTLRSGTMHR